jgi:NAD(P)H-hydrate repair Nnr-like enzyme with NAD(P)H-hydrate epimerase domain
MTVYHKVEKIKFTKETITLTIDGKRHTFKLADISQRLKEATQAERENFRISASGYGIHWPSIDEDLSIDSLLGIKHQPRFKKKIAS